MWDKTQAQGVQDRGQQRPQQQQWQHGQQQWQQNQQAWGQPQQQQWQPQPQQSSWQQPQQQHGNGQQHGHQHSQSWGQQNQQQQPWQQQPHAQHQQQGQHQTHGHHQQPHHQPNTVPLQDGTMPPFTGRSDTLVNAPTAPGIRKHYLKNPLPPPLLSRSPFIPRPVVEHLMRRKKDVAIGIKFVSGDAISAMEGTAHTFLTPLVFARMHGDYAYRGSHTVLPYAGAREVVVSAAIQPDFEDCQGMMALARVEHHPIQGADWPQWGQNIPSPSEKYHAKSRAAYDARVRAHLIHHLVRRLPALHEVNPLSVAQAIGHLDGGGSPTGLAVRLPAAVVSLELLWRAYIEALSNELGALEAACAAYVYTSDPPAIFARECDATLLNRLQASALAHLVALNPGRIKNMRVFAFNDYADPQVVGNFRHALAGTSVRVMRKAELFPSSRRGYYSPPAEGNGALLVLHNNSDAFGQNIETEGPGGSMDGAIGCNSSVAGSVRRDRHDLVSRVYARGARLRVR